MLSVHMSSGGLLLPGFLASHECKRVKIVTSCTGRAVTSRYVQSETFSHPYYPSKHSQVQSNDNVLRIPHGFRLGSSFEGKLVEAEKVEDRMSMISTL